MASVSSTMTNQQKQDFPVDAVMGPAKSLRGGKNLQDQIAEAPVNALRTPVIHGWKDAKGKEYSTSVAQQLAFNAQALAALSAQLTAQGALLQQIVTAVSKGVAVEIDYKRIEALMPKLPAYEVNITPVDPK